MIKTKEKTAEKRGAKINLKKYRGKNVLITGGLGFLGSNVACELAKLGAHVTVLSQTKKNIFNIEECKEKIKVATGDIRDQKLIEKLVKNTDIIFNFAAQVSYIDSPQIPFEDLEINCRGHLILLEAVKKMNPKARVIFSSSRMVIGKNSKNPVTEEHPTDPLNLYGIHKLAGEKYHQIYWRLYGIPTVVLRITNPYGKKQQIRHSKHSLPGWFMRQAMEGKTITIFGDGRQVRDYVYIDDITSAFLHVGLAKGIEGEIFNLGSGKAYQFREMVETIVKAVGTGAISYVPWPKNYEKIETGDFRITLSKINKATGWKPTTGLKEGVANMVEFYRKYKDKYI